MLPCKKDQLLLEELVCEDERALFEHVPDGLQAGGWGGGAKACREGGGSGVPGWGCYNSCGDYDSASRCFGYIWVVVCCDHSPNSAGGVGAGKPVRST